MVDIFIWMLIGGIVFFVVGAIADGW
jgi:hypothetical protein